MVANQSQNPIETPATQVFLTCSRCTGEAGTWAQHRNRDSGYGICMDCVAWLRNRGVSEEQIRDDYGVEGVNYGPATHKRVLTDE